MGLLDFFKDGNFDPAMAENVHPREIGGLLKQIAPGKSDKSTAIQRGLLAAGLGIMSAKTGGNLMSALGEGGMQGVRAYDDQMHNAEQEKMQSYQIQRQQKADAQDDTKFNNQQTTFNQGQQKTQAMQELAKKHLQQDGSFDTQSYVNEMYQYDPEGALDYQQKIDASKYRQSMMQQNNRAQFGGQELLKDEAGNLFYGTSVRDPSTRGFSSSLSAVDGSGVKPQGRLMVANNPYGLTSTERVTQVGNETTAKDNAGAVTAAKINARDFETTMSKINRAGELLPVATSSGLGSFRDKSMAVFGATTDAAKAAAELETIGGWLTSGVPKMPGATSDRDVDLFRIMAGNVADKSKPYEERLQQLNALKSFMESKNIQSQDIIQSNNAAPTQSLQQSPTTQKSGGVLKIDGKGRKAMVYPDGSYEVQ